MALREAVYLRAYSQKNPLLEYKLEGFQIFDDMLYEIKTNIARRMTARACAGEAGGPQGRKKRPLPVRRREEVQLLPRQ